MSVAVDISDQLDTYVSRYTVTFMNNQNGGSLGSGTLARLGNVFGVVTCGHNLAALEKLEASTPSFQIGLLLYPVRSQHQSRQIPRSNTDEVRLYCPGPSPRKSWRGPDLGFLKLPIAFAKEVESIASFVNLEEQLAIWQKPAPPSYVDVVAGNVQENSTTPLVQPPKQSTTMSMDGFVNVGKTHPRSPVWGEDRFYFKPTFAPNLKAPNSYEGTSGGGHWRIGFKQATAGDFAVVDRRLIGVAYYQTRQDRLIGHAASSIYQTLIPAMNRQWTGETSSKQ
jgi:hypothetical protein